MCLLVLAWNSHPRYRLVLAANRDEFHERPTAPLAWWPDEPCVLAGRDLRGHGTWLGATREGRIAVVTNFRDLESPPAADAPSRGDLVTRFLSGRASPASYLHELQPRAHRYAGFNLVVGDAHGLLYFSNRSGEDARSLRPGIYGLSNHLLDSPWPKLRRTRDRLAELVARPAIAPATLFGVLNDRQPADEAEIPDTGLPADWERALSAPFVVHERYGTRCSTLLVVDRDGRTTMQERRYDAAGSLTGATRLQFDGPLPGQAQAVDAANEPAFASQASVLHEKFATSPE